MVGSWNAVKSLPECAEVTEARQAFDLAKAPAPLALARMALALAGRVSRAQNFFTVFTCGLAANWSASIGHCCEFHDSAYLDTWCAAQA